MRPCLHLSSDDGKVTPSALPVSLPICHIHSSSDLRRNHHTRDTPDVPGTPETPGTLETMTLLQSVFSISTQPSDIQNITQNRPITDSRCLPNLTPATAYSEQASIKSILAHTINLFSLNSYNHLMFRKLSKRAH